MVRRSRRQRGGGQLQDLRDAVNNAEPESEAHREATQKLNAYKLTPEGIAEVEAEAEAERQKRETATAVEQSTGGRRRRRSRKSRRPRKSRRSRRSRKSRRSRRH